jgi:lipoprotein-anchoring transpeptidase ErfK/SrfK
MQFRSLLILGFGTSLMFSVAAIAGPPVPAISSPEAGAVVEIATKAEQDALKKKKAAEAAKKSKTKTAAKQQAGQTKSAAKAEAKAERAKLAKAKADRDKLAKARADREKQLAAAKAEKAKQAIAAKAERDRKVAAAKMERDKKVAAAKVAREKMFAERAKAAGERKIRLAKEAEIRKAAREKAAEERQVARGRAAEQRRQVAEAKARAVEERRMAQFRAEEARRAQVAAAADAARQAEISRLVSMDVVQSGNNSELRSETAVQAAPKQTGLFAGLFGGQIAPKPSMLPETRALDAAMELRATKKPFTVRPEYVPTVVEFGGYPRGTIVIDTSAHYLYLVEGSNRARRYAIAVGKDGLQYKGSVRVGDKQEWPRWIPTKDMQKREPAKYGKYADGMPGGGANPLGARAIYLYDNGRDTHLRIHGTIAPETIGTDSSNGCFRMINDHVIDLYRRVPVGTQVVVL